MENFEIAIGIKRKIQETRASVPKMEAELLEREKAQEDLDNEALGAEILEKHVWQKMKENADENRGIIRKLRDELESVGKKIEISEREFKSHEGAALNDIRKHFRKPLEAAVRKFAKTLEEVEKLELEITRIRDEAASMGHKITYIPYDMTPFIKLFLTDPSDPIRSQWPISEFRKDCERAGISLNGSK